MSKDEMSDRKKKSGRSRRPRGTGTIFYSPTRKVWIGRRPVGRNQHGRTIYREVSARTQREVIRLLEGLGPPGPDTTIAEWYQRWIRDLSVRTNTRQTYEKLFRTYILQPLGSRPVAGLKPYEIEMVLNRWVDKTSVTTAVMTLNCLGNCLQAAVRAGLIDANPVRKVKRPRSKKCKIEPFSPAETDQIIRESLRSRQTAIFALMATTGLRCGEAMGLQVTDFDPQSGMLSISRQLTLSGFGQPKSNNSTRTIRVPLAGQRAVELAKGQRTDGLLFTDANGRPFSHSRLARMWESLLGRCRLKYRNMHQLRHSVATLMIASGQGVADVASYLGDSVRTVVYTYVHPSGQDPSSSIDRLLDPSVWS